MPPNIIPLRPFNSPLSNYPFKLSTTTISSNANYGAGKSQLDCQCPCGIVGNTNITSSALFNDLLTDAQKADRAKNTTPGGKTHKAVVVAKESYLFRGLYLNKRIQVNSNDLTYYGTHNDDPVMRVYGLDQPIILDDWFQTTDPASADAVADPGSGDGYDQKDAFPTLKIWLTVCFPSGETTGQSQFTSCATEVLIDDKNNLSCGMRSGRPQVAFISYGLKMPKDLVVVKTIDKSTGTGTPPTPRIERRQIEAHVPIGEVNSKGQVVEQYIRQNLTLTDICFNGTPAKYPMPLFSGFTS